MRRSVIFFCCSVLASTAACGALRKPKAHGTGTALSGGRGGANGVSGGAAVGTADSGEGGTPEGTGGTGGVTGISTGGLAGAGLAGHPGASGASSGSAGAAAAGASSFALPDGCALVSQHGAGLYCSAEMTCQGTAQTVSCTADASGVWQCSCLHGTSSVMFEFPDATGARTCEVTASACLHPELLAGDEVCTLTDAGDDLTCTATDTCKREHEVDGVKVSSKTEWKASCKRLSDDVFTCNCTDQRTPDYWIKTPALSAGCKFLSPLCRSEEPPASDDWKCTAEYEESGPDYGCHSGKSCTQTLTLSDGTALTRQEFYNLNCRTIDGHTQCACEGASGFEKLTLVLGISADDIGACNVTIDACAGIEPLELAGSPECTTTTDLADPAYCERSFDCTQTGMTSRTQVTVQTTLGATCSRRDDGTWRCSCKAPSSGDPMELQADDSASACTAALERCPMLAPGLTQ